MRRILLVLTVAALMAAMTVMAGPAKADVSIGGGGISLGGGNSSNFSSGNFGGGNLISFGSDIGDNDGTSISLFGGNLDDIDDDDFGDSDIVFSDDGFDID